jgi:hypothetical protein
MQYHHQTIVKGAFEMGTDKMKENFPAEPHRDGSVCESRSADAKEKEKSQAEPYRDGTIDESRSASAKQGRKSQKGEDVLRGEG